MLACLVCAEQRYWLRLKLLLLLLQQLAGFPAGVYHPRPAAVEPRVPSQAVHLHGYHHKQQVLLLLLLLLLRYWHHEPGVLFLLVLRPKPPAALPVGPHCTVWQLPPAPVHVHLLAPAPAVMQTAASHALALLLLMGCILPLLLLQGNPWE
jgi:hypothetical protein